MDRRRPPIALLMPALSALALALVVTACGGPGAPSSALRETGAPAPVATPTPTLVGSGMLHLTTAPDYDPHDPLELRYILADGQIAPEIDSFGSETIIFLDRQLPAGPVRVLANDLDCSGTIPIEANLEIDAVLAVDNGICTVSVADSHALGSIVHAEPRTALGALIAVDSILVVEPLDPGNAMADLHLPADDRGEVLGIELKPGRYELTVRVDGAVLTTRELDVKRGTDFVHNLRVLAPDVPRDCGEITAAECEAAVAESYAWGYFLEAGQRVTSVRVRPSRYTGGCEPSEPPALDVEFDIHDEAGGESRSAEVTLGRTPVGNLFVCTY